MKNRKYIIVELVLFFASFIFLTTAIFFYHKAVSKNASVLNDISVLLDESTVETLNDASACFKGFDDNYLHFQEEIDSFYYLLYRQPDFNSENILNYWQHEFYWDSTSTDVLRIIVNNKSLDTNLFRKLLMHLFVNKLFRHEASFYSLFDITGSHVCSEKDTITMTEEYKAQISVIGLLSDRAEQIIVIDGDTLENSCMGYAVFEENPKKTGKIKHEGYVKCYHNGEWETFGFGLVYYVKE
jgi:hypothetical protein